MAHEHSSALPPQEEAPLLEGNVLALLVEGLDPPEDDPDPQGEGLDPLDALPLLPNALLLPFEGLLLLGRDPLPLGRGLALLLGLSLQRDPLLEASLPLLLEMVTQTHLAVRDLGVPPLGLPLLTNEHEWTTAPKTKRSWGLVG